MEQKDWMVDDYLDHQKFNTAMDLIVPYKESTVKGQQPSPYYGAKQLQITKQYTDHVPLKYRPNHLPATLPSNSTLSTATATLAGFVTTQKPKTVTWNKKTDDPFLIAYCVENFGGQVPEKLQLDQVANKMNGKSVAQVTNAVKRLKVSMALPVRAGEGATGAGAVTVNATTVTLDATVLVNASTVNATVTGVTITANANTGVNVEGAAVQAGKEAGDVATTGSGSEAGESTSGSRGASSANVNAVQEVSAKSNATTEMKNVHGAKPHGAKTPNTKKTNTTAKKKGAAATAQKKKGATKPAEKNIPEKTAAKRRREASKSVKNAAKRTKVPAAAFAGRKRGMASKEKTNARGQPVGHTQRVGTRVRVANKRYGDDTP